MIGISLKTTITEFNNFIYFYSAFAGIVNSVVVSPVELIKCRLQAQGEAIGSQSHLKYSSMSDCIAKTIKLDGNTMLHVAFVKLRFPQE